MPEPVYRKFDADTALVVSECGASPLTRADEPMPNGERWVTFYLAVTPARLHDAGVRISAETPPLLVRLDMAGIIIAQLVAAAKANGWDTALWSHVDQSSAEIRDTPGPELGPAPEETQP